MIICDNFNVVVKELPVGVLKNYTIDNTVEYIIEIKNLSQNIDKVPPRIFLKCNECNGENPLLVVVMQNKGVLSWELPVIIESKEHYSIYKETERTLCPYNIINSSLLNFDYSENNNSVIPIAPVKLTLSTFSLKKLQVELIVNLQYDFLIDLNESKTVNVTPSTPYFYLYEFQSEEVNSILLHVTSDDDTCMIVSIQNVSCPIFDLEENVQYRGHFQTITRQGGLTLTRDAFPNGFYIVLIVTGEDNYCFSKFLGNEYDRTKSVTVQLSKSISSSDYKIAVLLTLLVLSLFCTLMFTVFYYNYNKEKNFIPDDCFIESENEVSASVSNAVLPALSPSSPGPFIVGTDTLSIKTDSSLDETDYDNVSDVEFDKDIFRLKGYMYLCDLARKNQSVLKKKSEMYLWNLLTVAIFYFLPVLQLVITNQYQVNETGEEDLCYYNFLCAHPFLFFSDFNHVFSNIGYLLFGSLFIFITAMKERLYKIKIFSNKKLYRFYGIPQHFGLFYAMGAALIIEGILSACYHICPNHYNFQFDSSFMYVISTLCMIKIYQTRHPDINATAYSTFFSLAGVIFIGMCGVFNNTPTFWILFTILHLSICAYISLQIYYMGRWKLGNISFCQFFKELRLCFYCHWGYFKPLFPSRCLLLIVANGCNWGLAIGRFFYKIENFSSYLLSIFMVNLMLYTLFYIIMKFICKERLLPQSIFYILVSVLGWTFALYFFFSKTTSWRLTPAESRLYNQPCQLLNFYDNHDIWHFISAASMFFSFMVLLTLDDDITYADRSKILVF
ncbi:conserved hypothetical protein [Pediculus humanus corporis]|uniref:SID1 transmembrane family member 1 n=1 Tax=Pediculus humanus subsp. corporis TaxID=121224 RepID=E0VXD3_PEDHC|nr:uncharacterized protein Phum_PHUM498360 [Pediculus humanus corporis]EEB18039.1 conserved hypothetical protein [Pediculus humanus corporis]